MSISNTAKGLGVTSIVAPVVITGVYFGTSSNKNSSESNNPVENIPLTQWQEWQEEFKTVALTREQNLVEPFKQLIEDLKNSSSTNALKKVCLKIQNMDYDDFNEDLISQAREYCRFSTNLSDTLGNIFLPFDSEPEVWKRLQTELHTTQLDRVTNPFKSLKTKLPTGNQENGDLLKAECKKIINFFDFGTEKQKELKKQIKDFCSITIQKILSIKGKEIDFNDSSLSTKLKEKVEKLKSYNLSETNVADPSKDISLWQIKKEADDSTKEHSWKELKIWCTFSYSSPYLGATTNLWLLTEKFCTNDEA